MSRSRESYNKKAVREKKAKKKKEKEQKRLSRKENKTKDFGDEMFAYVDEFGRIISTPPDPSKKKEVKLEDISTSTKKQNPDSSTDKVREGILTNFNESKGFGFIIDSTTNESLFAHVTAFKDPIEEGNTVRFTKAKGDRGPVASSVELVK